ncbi:MAG: metallophosphoesterase [Chlamydiae bacterium]|nr:metallophosphoesterase [Chlamydiota bacterium]
MKAQKSYSVIFLLLTLFFFNQAEGSFRFVVYGDSRGPSLGVPYNSAVLDFINTQITNLNPRPAFVLFGGDMVYAGTDAGNVGNHLLEWKLHMDATMDGIPYYTTVGNRDLYEGGYPPVKEVEIKYHDTFDFLPENGPTAPIDYTRLVYSFEYGTGDDRSIFIVLDAWGFNGTIPYDNAYDTEQINWFAAQATSTANHKFVVSHGPVFSPEGWPVDRSAKQIWEFMEQNGFDSFYCGHEHIYARWNIDQSAYLPSFLKITQVLTGGAGASPDNPNTYDATAATPIYFGYNFVVVDIDGNTIKQHAYKVISNGDGTFYTAPLDVIFRVK